MVKGLDKFREYFVDFSEQYVLIGGAACDISFNEVGADFNERVRTAILGVRS